MSRGLDGLNLSSDVIIVYSIAKICNSGMGRVVSSEDLNGFPHTVWPVDILN